MTQFNKTTLKTYFETGDDPDGTDYANLIDSYVNQIETAVQNMAGPLGTTELSASRVSAGPTNLTSTLAIAGITSAQDIHAANIFGSSLSLTNTLTATGSLTIGGDITASGRVTSGSMTVSSIISAASVNVAGDVSAATGTVYASALRMGGGIFRNVAIISAAGTTQATGASLGVNGIIRAKGIADGSTTGFLLTANQTGLQQTIWIEENTSCNLWPCIGGQINALASNAAFPMAGNTQYLITHIKASGYAVK